LALSPLFLPFAACVSLTLFTSDSVHL
jgi:hypothetical protein